MEPGINTGQHTILPDDIALQQNLSKIQLFFQMTVFFVFYFFVCFCVNALSLSLSGLTQVKKGLLFLLRAFDFCKFTICCLMQIFKTEVKVLFDLN